MIYVIADDLTGANDTGVQLAKQGYNTVVSMISSFEDLPESDLDKTDVLVIDTETRDLDISTARARIKGLLDGLYLNPGDIVYKKVDSTLRGSIGTEIEEIMTILKKELCILSPAFPSNNRIIVGGYLIVQNKPLGLSEYYKGDLDPGLASFIPSLLKEQTALPIGIIDLKDVIRGKKNILKQINRLYEDGKKIIIIDAIDHQQLEDILLSSLESKYSVLYVGSAGLANHLSTIDKQEKKNSSLLVNSIEKKNKTVLIIVGSRSSMMNSQIDFLKNKLDIFEIKIDLDQIFLDREKILKSYFIEIVSKRKIKDQIIVRPDPRYNDNQVIGNILIERKLAFRELEVIIRNFMAELVKRVINHTAISNLILTGGDTAIGVCQALEINSLSILEELLPGIPISTDRTNKYNNLRIITKAGGFGNDYTLYSLIDKLMKIQQGGAKGLSETRKNEETCY